MDEDWSEPRRVLHHLRGAMGYDTIEKCYTPWDGECHKFEDITDINLGNSGITDADVAAWAERLRFPNLKRLSFRNTDITNACIPDMKKISMYSSSLEQMLFPPHIEQMLNALVRIQQLERAKERA